MAKSERYDVDLDWQHRVERLRGLARNEGARVFSRELQQLERQLEQEQVPALLEKVEQLLDRMSRMQANVDGSSDGEALRSWGLIYGLVSRAMLQLAALKAENDATKNGKVPGVR